VLIGAGLAEAIPDGQGRGSAQAGNLTIKLLPMTDQGVTIGCCGAAISTWCAGRTPSCGPSGRPPFLWHIYPQEEQAHMVKLDGFLDHYLAAASATGQWLRGFSHALNRGKCRDWWAQWPEHAAIWQQHGRPWSQKQLRDGDLVTRLVKFLESRI
jgi:hypothetical protein